jgi:protein involved in polysaccharide export with SLBB domain
MHTRIDPGLGAPGINPETRHPLPRHNLPFFLRVVALLLAALVGQAAGSACTTTPVSAPANGAPQPGASVDSTTTPPRVAYQLGSGDKLRVIVFGEEDLSGEFEVDDTGAVSLPLVGEVGAGGRTLRNFEAAVREQLSDGYLKDPRVSVQVINYRPFYIIGEVEKGGEYPFVSGMHLLNAVAVAGGFTYRANTSKVFITRGSRELEFAVTPELRLEPGDVIRVPERFF